MIRTMPYYVNAILNCISEFANTKWDGIVTHWPSLLIYLWNLFSVSFFPFQINISDARQNFREDSEPNPLLVPITYIAAKKVNHLEESEMTPRLCLDEDSEFKRLTSSCDTTLVKLLPESVRFLQSQLQVERLGAAQVRLEVQSLTKIKEDTRACFIATRLELEDLMFRQLRSHQLVQLLALQHRSRANVSWTVLKCYRFCILFCRRIFLRGWRPLMPSVCNLRSGCPLLSLVASFDA